MGETTEIANDDKRTCLNCDASLGGRFCHDCGQDSSRGRLVAGELVTGFFGSLLSMDSRYTRTFFALVRHPGKIALSYVEGKRRSFSNPVAYFVAAMTINLLVPVVVGFWIAADEAEPEWLSTSVATPLALTLFLPIATLWTWLFKESQRNLAENYAFTLYLFAQLLLYEVLLSPVTALLADDWVAVILGVALVAMFVFGAADFYRTKKRVVILKFSISLAVVFAIMIPVGVVIELLAPGLIG